MNKNEKTNKLVRCALFCAIVCIATMVIHIPIGTSGGYVNLGDCAVILAGFMLGPIYGAAAAGIGSALSDILLGWAMYAPATFIIKAIMALVAAKLYKFPATGKSARILISCIICGIIMASGYFVFDSILYGFSAATVNLLTGNSWQALMGIISSFLLTNVLKKIPGIEKLF